MNIKVRMIGFIDGVFLEILYVKFYRVFSKILQNIFEEEKEIEFEK